ncbi:DNA replication protein [Leuconostoc lactis]|uniref:DNA replication protein n=1 Tax=Leuconostoc lactis TaxID=1246 RepID=A0AAP9J9H4_LEULA|nr:DNA replication protein [Leuconostoc lactis]QEA43281.1 DNA replication protein [Leuconostoc lactis]
MAQRRMFSKKVTDTDTFLDMPLSSQALYFHLNMHADDDGFIDNTKTIQRMIGSSEDDLKLLTAKQFIFPFETGVVVIKDWLVHNYIRKDTYNKTMYPNELEQLQVNDSGQYENKKFVTSTERPRLVDDTLTQVRLGKDRLGKDSKDILSGSDEPDSKRIQKSERDQMFETIWKLYPKKSGKANAKKDFDNAIKSGVDPELIKSKLEEYLKQIKAKQTPQQFIKQGSTWFHQAGWEDEYDFTPEVRQTNGYGRQKREAVVPKFLKG